MPRIFSLCIIVALGLATSPRADEAPSTTATLELVGVPPAASVAVDGREVGDQRRFEFTGLKAGELQQHEVTVEFPGSGKTTQAVLLRGGWHVRAPIDPPQTRRVEPVLQVGHQSQPMDMAFSPDGRRLVTGGGDRLAIIWDAFTGRRLRALTVNDAVNAVAFSPDGAQILLACGQRGIRSRDMGGMMERFAGNGGDAESAATARRARAALEAYKKLTPNAEQTLVIDARSGRVVHTLPSDSGGVGAASFSPDGRWIATAAWFIEFRNCVAPDHGEAVLWDRKTGKRQRSWPLETVLISALGFTRDSGRLVAASRSNESGAVHIWDVKTGERTGGFALAKEMRAAMFDAATEKVLVTQVNSLETFDLATGRNEHTVALRNDGRLLGAMTGARLSPDGRQAVLTLSSKTQVFDLASGREVFAMPAGEDDFLCAAAFSPDGKRLAATRSTGDVHLLDLAGNRPPRVLRGRSQDGFSPASASPDGRFLAIRRLKGLTIWDLQTGRRNAVIEGVASDFRTPFSRDGSRLAAVDKERTSVLVIETATGRIVRRLPPPWEHAQPKVVAFAGNDALLVNYRDRVALWDIERGRTRWVAPAKGRFGHGTLVLPDDTVLVAGEDGHVRRWDLAEGRISRTYPGRYMNPEDAVPTAVTFGSAPFSPDGKLLLTPSPKADGMTIWDVEAGVVRSTLRSPRGIALEGHFTGDGRHVILNSGRDVAIFDWREGRELMRFNHGTLRAGLTRLPGDRYALLASMHGFVTLYDLATGQSVGMLLNAGDDWLVTSPRGLFDGSAGGQQVVSYRMPGGEVVPVDRFYQDFYTAGLLPRLLAGERPLPPAELGASKAPRVRFVNAPPDGPAQAGTVTLEVEVEDQGGGALPPWLTHNGRRLQLPGQPEQDGKLLKRRFVVELAPGDNLLEIRSASDDGSWESEPVSVMLTYKAAVPAPELYVLAIGVGQYADESLNLQFAGNDARALGELFRRRGRPLYAAVHVTALIDQRATRTEVRNALRAIAGKARPQDTVLVVIAGHGTVVGSGEYYFLPHDFRQRAERLEDDVRRQGIGAAMLGEWLATVPALKRLLVLDTCHSGAVVRRGGSRNPFALREATQRLARSQGVFTIAAAASGQEAKEVRELGHGVLSYCLLAGLGAVDAGPLKGRPLRPGESRDVAEVLEWFQYAHVNVPHLTKQYFGREQDVQFDLSGDSFPVLPLKDVPNN